MTEKSKFTKREWIHLIITLSIIQAFIWWVSFQFSNSSNALGYVSFAGTLISIILAVLAIGYTYGESQQQKNSSNTLSTQIDSLIKIKEKLEIQADALIGIKELHNFLGSFDQKIDGHFKETKTKIDTFTNNFQSFDSKKMDVAVSEIINSKETLSGIFNSKPSHFLKLCLIISILFCENKKIGDSYGKIKNYIRTLDIEEFGEEELESIFFGGCVNLLSVLNGIGVIKSKGNHIDSELIYYFNDFINDDEANFNNSFNGASLKVKSLGKTSKYYNK